MVIVTTVNAALNSLKIATEAFVWLRDSRRDAEANTRIASAMQAVNDAEQKIFELRRELSLLEDENQKLRSEKAELDDWNKRFQKLHRTKTAGGAVVYVQEEGEGFLICPRCVEKKEMQILQDHGRVSGEFECPGCGNKFKVKPTRSGQVRMAPGAGDLEL